MYLSTVNKQIPSITESADASINPGSGVAKNFNADVEYTVTAENGDTQKWIVNVENELNTENDIIAFTINGQSGNTSIDESYYLDTSFRKPLISYF